MLAWCGGDGISSVCGQTLVKRDVERSTLRVRSLGSGLAQLKNSDVNFNFYKKLCAVNKCGFNRDMKCCVFSPALETTRKTKRYKVVLMMKNILQRWCQNLFSSPSNIVSRASNTKVQQVISHKLLQQWHRSFNEDKNTPGSTQIPFPLFFFHWLRVRLAENQQRRRDPADVDKSHSSHVTNGHAPYQLLLTYPHFP